MNDLTDFINTVDDSVLITVIKDYEAENMDVSNCANTLAAMYVAQIDDHLQGYYYLPDLQLNLSIIKEAYRRFALKYIAAQQ